MSVNYYINFIIDIITVPVRWLSDNSMPLRAESIPSSLGILPGSSHSNRIIMKKHIKLTNRILIIIINIIIDIIIAIGTCD